MNDYTYFNLEPDKIEITIRKHFPKIVKDDKGIFYYFNKEKKHFIEMKDNSIKSDFEELIYKYWRHKKPIKDNEGTIIDYIVELLKSNQVKDLKKAITRYIKFDILKSAPCYLINCRNGVIDIRKDKNNKLLDDNIRQEYFFDYCLDIDYNPNADTKKLFNFVNQVITENDPISLLAKILGHIHYQESKLQKMFLFKGTKKGRNGKGTLVKLIIKTIGSHRTLVKTIGDFERSSFATYALKDKVLYIEDDYKEDFINSKTLGLLNKMITGINEDVHQKNCPAIDMTHKAVPILQCNKMPKLKADDDGGFYLRWVIINFSNEFGDSNIMDEFLGSDLVNDDNVMSSMLNLLIEGYNEILYRKENKIKGEFFKSNEINDINDWKKTNNSVMQFVDDCCEIDNNSMVSSRGLYNYYRNDWNLGGSKMSENKFISILKESYDLISKRKRIDNKRLMCLIGIKFNENNRSINIDDKFVNI